MNLGAAATSSKNALQWEIPLPQIMHVCYEAYVFFVRPFRVSRSP